MPADATGSPGSDTANLAKIDHIVVLMLENRSFDHMLGYLSLEGGRDDIDGLRVETRRRQSGSDAKPHHLHRTALTKAEDPDHSGGAVATQINRGKMDGFVTSYAHVLGKRRDKLAAAGVQGDPSLVMGYYNHEDLPVYDHLAEHYCVCDQWHSSVPGATWPNRLYAVTGRADGSRDDRPAPEPPLYDKPSFVRHLDAADVSWRWYSYDPATLRCADAEYWVQHLDHFSFVDKAKLRWPAAVKDAPFIDEDSASFVEDAARGRLPSVSWIDPNFNDLNLFGIASNDDHPPSDVRNGQDLVLLVYRALATSPLWDKTMLIVTYDEHGGFYDHVAPPKAPDDDEKNFGEYGVRVPALIVSPWVAPRSVSKTLYDHTSIIKTILERFCPRELDRPTGLGKIEHWLKPGHPHYMGQRVAAARTLGEVLAANQARPAPNHDDLLQDMVNRRQQAIRDHLTADLSTPTTSELTELQISMATAARKLRTKGLPPGHP